MFSNDPVPCFCFSFELFSKTVHFRFSCTPVANEVSPVLVSIIGQQLDLTQFAHNVFFPNLENVVVAFFMLLLLFLLGWRNARLCVQGLVPKSVPAHRGILHHVPMSFGTFCSSWNPFAASAKSATQCTIWCRRLSLFLFMFCFFMCFFGRSFG